tara:strand:+ start:199 stop:678 length:480 start_codon:yes stop_codon:yes gene_type:complete
MLKINEKVAISVDLGGRGGKERSALRLFENDLIRDDHILFDAKDSLGNKYEFKKQANQQWFDIGKYHNLTQEQKDINMVFLIHKDGALEKAAVIKLGKFIERLTTNPKYAKCGWTKKMIKFMYEVKKLHPRFQTKALVKVKEFLLDNSDVTEILYEKNT